LVSYYLWRSKFGGMSLSDAKRLKELETENARREVTKAVATVPARALGRRPVTRVLEQLAVSRGLPQILRTDNGPEFCERAMLTWAQSQPTCRQFEGLRVALPFLCRDPRECRLEFDRNPVL
jgi:hypothetical protein